MKKQKSKVDTWLVLVVIGIVVAASLPFILVDEAPLIWLVISGVVLLVLADMVVNTTYVIDGRTLTIRCGLLMKERCDIMDITAVRPTRTPVSSPAMSLDRLELKLRVRSIIISPKDKERFVDDLRAVNPDIKVEAGQ